MRRSLVYAVLINTRSIHSFNGNLLGTSVCLEILGFDGMALDRAHTEKEILGW